MTYTRQNPPKKPVSIAIFLLFPLWISTSCGDENPGGAFLAPEPGQDDAEYGPASPLQAGTEHWYNLITSYKRTAESDSSGLTQHEVQGTGHLCVKIDEVRDIHTEAYKDEVETIVSGRVKISGPSGASQMFISDQDNPNATAEEVDSYLNNLWLKRLVGPSAAHGYESVASVDFRTQVGPTPTNFDYGLAILPFFEARSLAKELEWSGWTSLGGELEGARNLTSEIFSYFQNDPFDLTFMASPANFKTKVTTPPSNCEDFSELAECVRTKCTWATPVDSNINSCIGLHRIGFAWKHRISAPDIQVGDVLHFIEFQYYENGTLYKSTEDIRPDNGSGENLSADFPVETCNLNCQSADLSIRGGFNDDPAYPAPCGF